MNRDLKAMHIDDIPKRTHLGFKIACMVGGRSMRETLITYMYNLAEANDVWGVVDKQLEAELMAKETKREEEETAAEIGDMFNDTSSNG